MKTDIISQSFISRTKLQAFLAGTPVIPENPPVGVFTEEDEPINIPPIQGEDEANPQQ